MWHVCFDKVLTAMGESRGLFAATYGPQDQSKQIASDTAQQTLQMEVFPHNGRQRQQSSHTDEASWA